MAKRLLVIFISALVLNLIWEELHSVLYVSYKGAEITNLILFRAALFDAAVIMFFSCPLILWESNSYSGCRSLTPTILFVGLLTLFAILLEKWALATGRWVYADSMPIVPYLWVGLTPTLQLGLTGFFAFWFANKNWIHPR